MNHNSLKEVGANHRALAEPSPKKQDNASENADHPNTSPIDPDYAEETSRASSISTCSESMESTLPLLNHRPDDEPALLDSLNYASEVIPMSPRSDQIDTSESFSPFALHNVRDQTETLVFKSDQDSMAFDISSMFDFSSSMDGSTGLHLARGDVIRRTKTDQERLEVILTMARGLTAAQIPKSFGADVSKNIAKLVEAAAKVVEDIETALKAEGPGHAIAHI